MLCELSALARRHRSELGEATLTDGDLADEPVATRATRPMAKLSRRGQAVRSMGGSQTAFFIPEGDSSAAAAGGAPPAPAPRAARAGEDEPMKLYCASVEEPSWPSQPRRESRGSAVMKFLRVALHTLWPTRT
jgi:hypothetical protein